MNFPGSPVLEIEAFDYDDFFSDDLIGKTTLELDDRYFSNEWQALEDKPIEYRDLFHPDSSISQGVLKIWVEIDEKDGVRASQPPVDISPRPNLNYECRVVIWKTRDIMGGDFENTADIYCRAFFDPDHDLKTDTHWRAQNGTASFNYRLKLGMQTLMKNRRLTI